MDIHAKLYSDAFLSDSNPSIIHTSFGGVARNIIDNLSRMGNECMMLSAVGDDAFGKSIVDDLKLRSIDASRILVCDDYPTGSYIALLEKDGNLNIAACDARIIENIPLTYFEDNKDYIKNAAAIVCDPNLSATQIKKIKELAGDVKIFIDPVSRTKARKLIDILDSFYLIKPNIYELEELSGMECKSDSDIQKACEIILSHGTSCIAVSLGKKGCYYADVFGNKLFRKLNGEFVVADETGAGDAFIAGMVTAITRNYDIEKCLDYALCAGSIAIESSDTISQNLSDENIIKYIKKYSRG